jgi:hypothetical protein
MPFDKKKAAKYADDNALPVFGNGRCAAAVREALESGGLNTAHHPVAAKDWGTTLIRMGFSTVANLKYSAAVGDVVVFQNVKGHDNGHIELYDGKNWVSDFIQDGFWPSRSYEVQKASYQIYRHD